MRTLIDKINKFEDGLETVEKFNEIFSHCPISGFDLDKIVTIGECCSPETSRIVTIDENSFRHDFVTKPEEIIEELELEDDA